MTEIRLRPMYRWLLGLGLAGALILMLPIRVAEPESEAPKTIRSNDAAQVVVPASVAQLVGDPLGGNDLESNANRGRSADNLHAALLNDFNNLTNGRAFAEKHWQNRDHGGSLYVRTLLKQCELAADSGDVLKRVTLIFRSSLKRNLSPPARRWQVFRRDAPNLRRMTIRNTSSRRHRRQVIRMTPITPCCATF